jgi:phytanoyl-CoA dioxygenase PhyH
MLPCQDVRLEWRDYSISNRGRAAGAQGPASRLVVDTADDPRDLSFHPADPAKARTLAAEQVEYFNANGFLSGLDIFDGDETARIQRYISDLVEKVVSAPDPRNEYSIFNYQLVCRGLFDIIQTPRILDLAEDILGKDFVCWNTHLFYKPPHDPKEVPFHQDAVYWPMTPARTVTVWIALDDVDPGNAAMQFLPGTHLLGAVDHEQRSLDGTRALRREAVGASLDGPRYSNTLRAGQASLHSDLLLHGSAANNSARRRAALTIRYAGAEVRPLRGAEWYVSATTHCRGTIPGHWPNRRRPTSEHPELLSHLWGDFDGTPTVGDDQRASDGQRASDSKSSGEQQASDEQA